MRDGGGGSGERERERPQSNAGFEITRQEKSQGLTTNWTQRVRGWTLRKVDM